MLSDNFVVEQAKNTKPVNDLIAVVNVLTGKVDELTEKVDKPKPIIDAADTRPAQEIMNKGVPDIKLIVGSKPQSDNQKEVQREELKTDRINKAWYYLYEHESKVRKKMMDSAYKYSQTN